MRILLSVLSFVSLSAFADPAARPNAARPNILYFYVDDMGWGSIGANGQAERLAKGLPNVQTPNLDRLVSQGVNFTRAYGCTVCSPARSSQQTGFHQGHTFADRNDPDNAKKAMRAEDILMGDVLAEAGYVTGYWGKWGYGGSKDQENPKIENVQTLPTSHGYQHVLAELHHVRAHTFFQPTLWGAPAAKAKKGGLELVPNSMKSFVGNSEYPAQPSNHSHPDYPDTAYCDDVYAFAALDFVREQSQNFLTTGQPFFGLLAVQIPHAPFDEITVLPDWNQAYTDDPHFAKLAAQSKQWAAMVTRIDAHFGNILASLDDPNGDGNQEDSVADDTLVIFMSDNGGPGGKSNVEFDANGGLRGTKGSIYEGGIRVPTIMKWPSRITDKSSLRAGTNSDLVIDVSDLLPTFCELAGKEIPLGIDGVSLAPLLLDAGDRCPREFLIHEAGKSQSIIRGKDKLVRTPKGLELYDLDADSAEKVNRAGKNKALVQELEALLLGERVDEPRGFANTYHHWIGPSGASASEADNWSDYEYSNEGITYQTDDGAPQLSWTATMTNAGSSAAVAKGDSDLEFLGLEIRGGEGKAATQELRLEEGVNLTGRNEVRLSEGAILTLKAGAVTSLRWLDVKPGAVLQGSGKVEGTLYNAGTVSIVGRGKALRSELIVAGDYQESSEANLALIVDGSQKHQIMVSGIATLAGSLSVDLSKGRAIAPGVSFPVLRAKQVEGRFSNPSGEVIVSDGTSFQIRYTNTEVTLTVIGEASS